MFMKCFFNIFYNLLNIYLSWLLSFLASLKILCLRWTPDLPHRNSDPGPFSICCQNPIRTSRQFTKVIRNVVLVSYCLGSKPSSTTMWPLDKTFNLSEEVGKGASLRATGGILWIVTASTVPCLEFSKVLSKSLLLLLLVSGSLPSALSTTWCLLSRNHPN